MMLWSVTLTYSCPNPAAEYIWPKNIIMKKFTLWLIKKVCWWYVLVFGSVIGAKTETKTQGLAKVKD